MKILVINSGSSSLKCSLFQMPRAKTLAQCAVERIGEGGGRLSFQAGENSIQRDCPAEDHAEALNALLQHLVEHEGGGVDRLDEIQAVGHRVVHGGERISHSVPLDQTVMEAIRQNAALAPLHNPANLMGIKAALEQLSEAFQVAVFDTAFHASMPPRAYLYALPRELYERHHIRRYGFHGTSHRYVAERAADILSMPPEQCNLITVHLGNGCSAAAVQGGRSIDTSMGLTPLEGLVMGTRCGDVDPALPFLLSENLGMSSEQVYDILNRRSGLAGLSGVSNDMREVLGAAEAGDRWAKRALEVFCYRIKKYIGAYAAVLGRLDALVFTAGIGENSPEVRRRVCEGLGGLGLRLDEEKNAEAVGREAAINSKESEVSILVVPTDEALKIAMDTYQLCLQHSCSGGGERS